MRKVSYVILGLLLLVVFVQAQLTITKEITKKTGGEFMVEGKSFDEVWSGLTKSLMLLEFRIKEQDKEGGIMIAYDAEFVKEIRKLSKAVGGRSFDESDAPTWQILIEEVVPEHSFKLSCFYFSGSGKKPFERLYAKLKETLFNE